MKKTIITMLITSMLVAMFAFTGVIKPANAQSSDGPNIYPTNPDTPTTTTETVDPDSTDGYFDVIGMGNQYTEEQSDQIVDAASLMDQFIQANENNFELMPQAKEVVDPFIYEYYKHSVDNLNQMVERGLITIDLANKTIVPTDTAENLSLKDGPTNTEIALSNSDDTTNSTVKKYWYGVKWYLSYKESKKWQNKFQDYAFGWGTVAALAGLLAGSIPVWGIGAALAAVIMSVGNYYLYVQLRDHTSSRGSVLVFKWDPPSAYAYKR